MVSDAASQSETLRQPAAIVEIANKRLHDLDRKGQARLHIAGFDTENMKARGFVEHEMPLTILSDEVRKIVDLTVRELVSGAREVENALGFALTLVLGKIKRERGQRWIASERFWAETEEAFFTLVRSLRARLVDEDQDEVVAEEWRSIIARAARRIFDDLVPPATIDAIKPQAYVAARRTLHDALAGYGKIGKRIFDALKLKQPERKKE